jgi:hypothetical protein
MYVIQMKTAIISVGSVYEKFDSKLGIIVEAFTYQLKD